MYIKGFERSAKKFDAYNDVYVHIFSKWCENDEKTMVLSKSTYVVGNSCVELGRRHDASLVEDILWGLCFPVWKWHCASHLRHCRGLLLSLRSIHRVKLNDNNNQKCAGGLSFHFFSSLVFSRTKHPSLYVHLFLQQYIQCLSAHFAFRSVRLCCDSLFAKRFDWKHTTSIAADATPPYSS